MPPLLNEPRGVPGSRHASPHPYTPCRTNSDSSIPALSIPTTPDFSILSPPGLTNSDSPAHTRTLLAVPTQPHQRRLASPALPSTVRSNTDHPRRTRPHPLFPTPTCPRLAMPTQPVPMPTTHAGPHLNTPRPSNTDYSSPARSDAHLPNADAPLQLAPGHPISTPTSRHEPCRSFTDSPYLPSPPHPRANTDSSHLAYPCLANTDNPILAPPPRSSLRRVLKIKE